VGHRERSFCFCMPSCEPGFCGSASVQIKVISATLLAVRVLVVEDEIRLAENVVAALREGPGFAVDHAADGSMGVAFAENRCYDLIVLDLMLPLLDGRSVLRKLRSAGDQTPVLVLTAKSESESIIDLLNSGADDYLTKPFDLGELIARAKALIRRGKGVADSLLRLGSLELNTLEQTVSRDQTQIDLSPTEYRILEYMMHRPRVVVSKRELLEHLYDYNWEHHSNVIEAHVSNLRRKLDANAAESSIETLRGRGYRLSVENRELL
jgi:DNA-binding response OmpR family regulator